jgi:hypothetical protein
VLGREPANNVPRKGREAMGEGERETAKAGETVAKTRLKARKTALRRFKAKDFNNCFRNDINIVKA